VNGTCFFHLWVFRNKSNVIKGVCGRMERAERIFKSPIVLEVCQITTVIYVTK